MFELTKALRNLIALIVLNVWLVGTGKGYVSYCPQYHNATALNRFGMKHCDVCGYHQGGEQ